jgi:hypothetical protein
MNKNMAKAIRKIMARFGLSVELINESFVDYRNQAFHPRLATVYNKPIVILAEVKDSRWKANGKPIDVTHPLVQILRQAVDSSSQCEFEKSIRDKIFNYYADYQPVGLWECIGVDYSSRFDCFPLPCNTNNPPWPWSLHTYEKKEKTAIMINRRMVKKLASEHGVQHWGPSSSEKIEAEIFKFGKLFDSIRMNGFTDFPSNRGGFVEVDVLMNRTGDWSWMVEQGQHRVMMCAALDIAEINIRVRRVLTEESIEYFPYVVNGLYSVDEAEKIFHRIIGNKEKLMQEPIFPDLYN